MLILVWWSKTFNCAKQKEKAEAPPSHWNNDFCVTLQEAFELPFTFVLMVVRYQGNVNILLPPEEMDDLFRWWKYSPVASDLSLTPILAAWHVYIYPCMLFSVCHHFLLLHHQLPTSFGVCKIFFPFSFLFPYLQSFFFMLHKGYTLQHRAI